MCMCVRLFADIFETNAPNAGEISAEPVSLSSSNKRPAMDSMPIAPMSYPIPQSGPFSDDPKRPRIDIVNLPIAMAPVSAPVVPMVPMAGVVMPPMPVTMVPTVQLPPQPPKYLAQLLPEEVFNSGRAPFGLFNVRISQESDAMDEYVVMNVVCSCLVVPVGWGLSCLSRPTTQTV